VATGATTFVLVMQRPRGPRGTAPPSHAATERHAVRVSGAKRSLLKPRTHLSPSPGVAQPPSAQCVSLTVKVKADYEGPCDESLAQHWLSGAGQFVTQVSSGCNAPPPVRSLSVRSHQEDPR